jgi:hypothetical protein
MIIYPLDSSKASRALVFTTARITSGVIRTLKKKVLESTRELRKMKGISSQ